MVAKMGRFPITQSGAPRRICDLEKEPIAVSHSHAAATGRKVHHLFAGSAVAEAGQLKLLRETFNPLAMAQAQLPNGAADVGPPGNEVRCF